MSQLRDFGHFVKLIINAYVCKNMTKNNLLSLQRLNKNCYGYIYMKMWSSIELLNYQRRTYSQNLKDLSLMPWSCLNLRKKNSSRKNKLLFGAFWCFRPVPTTTVSLLSHEKCFRFHCSKKSTSFLKLFILQNSEPFILSKCIKHIKQFCSVENYKCQIAHPLC